MKRIIQLFSALSIFALLSTGQPLQAQNLASDLGISSESLSQLDYEIMQALRQRDCMKLIGLSIQVKSLEDLTSRQSKDFNSSYLLNKAKEMILARRSYDLESQEVKYLIATATSFGRSDINAELAQPADQQKKMGIGIGMNQNGGDFGENSDLGFAASKKFAARIFVKNITDQPLFLIIDGYPEGNISKGEVRDFLVMAGAVTLHAQDKLGKGKFYTVKNLEQAKDYTWELK